ncbi:MAG: hypothetical protein DHS20C14_19460 [Phycisphaeraceae bacterium]|nr:MAG: hypothetical protein DHS20C14_19460 [Phycisphaeraceae bacterium]
MPAKAPSPDPDRAPTPAPTKALVWCRPDQTVLVRAIADAAGLEIASAGSPDPSRATQIAADFEAAPADDLRAALAATDAGVALIADPGTFGAGGSEEDAGAVAAARARGTRIVTLEPIPPTAMDVSGSAWTTQQAGGRPVDLVRLGALPRRTPAWRAAGEALEAFGTVRSMSVELITPALAGSLGAALVGALDLVVAMMGEPESVDGALLGSARGAPGDSVRGLAGDLCAVARTPDGRGATLLASDQGGAWSCAATMLGDGGTLRITQRGFVWIAPDGGVLDEHESPDSADRAATAVRVIADRITRLLDPGAPEQAPDGLPEVLAVAQAVLLSARTGQPESPTTIQRLVAR